MIDDQNYVIIVIIIIINVTLLAVTRFGALENPTVPPLSAEKTNHSYIQSPRDPPLL